MVMRALWGSFPVAIVFGLSFLPTRFNVRTALAKEQTWGCRAVSSALAVVIAVNLLWMSFPLASLRALGQGSLWAIELTLLLSQLLYVTPVVLIVVLRERGNLRSLGLTHHRALFLSATATAAYSLLVFVWSLPRYFGRLDWSDLYTNKVFGDFLARGPMEHALLIVLLVATGACVDEIVVRGFALIPISRVIGPTGGIVATALIWSLAHFADLGRTAGIFVLGLPLGWMFLRTGSLIPSLTFHVLWNLGSVSDFGFGRLAQAGVRLTSWEHFLYIGLGSLGIAVAAMLVAFLAWPRDRAD
jgi:membrane protease YdiL (CAAX protease family)